MSISCLAYVMKFQIDPLSRATLLYLAEQSDTYGRCDFSLEHLAQFLNRPKNIARKALNSLVKDKIIILVPSNKPKRTLEPWLAAMLFIDRNMGIGNGKL